MKNVLLGSLCLLMFTATAQLNVELLSNIDYEEIGNDVWGYVGPNGEEYALYGTFEGLYIVDITDPRNPEELFFIEQQNSIWRDIKTWDTYAYVVADQARSDDGILVIDLSELPDNIQYENQNPVIPDVNDETMSQTLDHCHNIYIDEFGYAYLAGCSGKPTIGGDEQEFINGGGLLIFDVLTDPSTPSLVSQGFPTYSHDVYVQDNRAYSSEIFAGVFSIYDVSNKSNIQYISSQETPSRYTHNTWASEDNKTLFTTDELANAFVGSYDISDPTDIRLLDRFRPQGSIGKGTIPHNVHVWKDWLVISYYTDGCIIVDASRPNNLIEVGNFDTYPQDSVEFRGAWGAFPFFPSENIIVGDRQSGLFVLGPEYKKAAYLEGYVYDKTTNEPINAANVNLVELGINKFSKGTGEFATGTAEPGLYTMTISKNGYRPYTQGVNLIAGEVNEKTIFLERKDTINLTGKVTELGSGAPISDVDIVLFKGGLARTSISRADGSFSRPNIEEGTYWVIAAKWGHRYNVVGQVEITESNPAPVLDIVLELGYEDIFSLDLGWTSEFVGLSGEWWRAVPIGTNPPGLNVFVAPNVDARDRGARAYITGQSPNFDFGKLVGSSTLISPVFDVSYMDDPTITFESWFWATDADFNILDNKMSLSISNGQDSVVALELGLEELGQLRWTKQTVRIADYITVTDSMRITLHAENQNSDDIVEAGFDHFRIIENANVSTADLSISESQLQVYPNPSSSLFTVDISKLAADHMRVYDISGSLVHQQALSTNQANVEFGAGLEKGLYLIQLEQNRKVISHARVLKID